MLMPSTVIRSSDERAAARRAIAPPRIHGVAAARVMAVGPVLPGVPAHAPARGPGW